jgi:integrase
MLLEDEASDREPWEMGELRTLFRSPVYASNARPKGGRGEAAYWLPLLGSFTGARLGELASLAVGDVTTDEETGITILRIVEDEERGRRLKTVSSRRMVPVHHELVKLGFLDVVERRRVQDGERAAIFPRLTQGPKGGYGEGWSKWLGRYIRSIGINNRARVFHSFRHGFKDALRAAGVSEDLSDALTGHSGGGVGRRYGANEMARRFGLHRLAEAVEAVRYPGLDLSHLTGKGSAYEPCLGPDRPVPER